jgi:8-oxo-dGTP pyrophosphatase MutT (NUDIX family)
MISCIRFLFRCYYFLLNLIGGKVVGARAIIISPDKKQILLVYHTYCPDWHLPGGGVNRGEHPLQAVKREVFEEAGIRCLKEPRFWGVYYQRYMGVDDYPILYIIEDFTQEMVKSSEIKESRWFPIDQLPSDIHNSSHQRIREYFFQEPLSLGWKNALTTGQ